MPLRLRVVNNVRAFSCLWEVSMRNHWDFRPGLIIVFFTMGIFSNLLCVQLSQIHCWTSAGSDGKYFWHDELGDELSVDLRAVSPWKSSGALIKHACQHYYWCDLRFLGAKHWFAAFRCRCTIPLFVYYWNWCDFPSLIQYLYWNRGVSAGRQLVRSASLALNRICMSRLEAVVSPLHTVVHISRHHDADNTFTLASAAYCGTGLEFLGFGLRRSPSWGV